MTRHLSVFLLCIIAVEAARYGDYSGVRMPHYSIEYENKEQAPLTDEYLDRSPDAAASFDYKYEEEPRVKADTTDQEDAWQMTKIKRKRPHKEIDDRKETYADEHDIIPKLKSNSRIQKHRTRIKDVYKESEKRSKKYQRSRNDDVDDIDNRREYNVNRKLSRDDNRVDLENLNFRDTTRRISRRKPRDRTLSRDRLNDVDVPEAEVDLKGQERDEDKAEIEFQKEDRRETLERNNVPFLALSNKEHKNYPEYDEYYDMKRVNRIKNKLPRLFRQTKVPARMSPSQEITYNRRANLLEKITEAKQITERSTTETTTKVTESTVYSLQSTVLTSRETTTVRISTNSSDLSLAEKSRLSILKKAQRKENLNVTWTTKPPVLMQVTKQMQTLVMVESQKNSANFRAHDFFDDSPEKVHRAKKLMRHKLVAGARNINDLIDNWDEMVCDYIDVSLLDSGDHHLCSDFKLILLSVFYQIFKICFNTLYH